MKKKKTYTQRIAKQDDEKSRDKWVPDIVCDNRDHAGGFQYAR